MHTRSSLADDLRRLGVRPGDILMLHASIRAVGPIAGGPDQIHLAVSDAVGPGGTVLMYASCPDHYDEVGRGHLTPEQEQELLEKLPPFDPDTARSARDNGALVELFRTWPGTVASRHVTRFVARGQAAAALLHPQPWDYAMGTGSPLARLAAMGGRILLLGSDHDNVTFLHHAEHIAGFDGKRIARFRVPVLEDGERVWREMAEVDTSDAGAHAHWPDRFFARIVDAHLAATGNAGGPVGDAHSYLIDAPRLLSFACDAMVAVAADATAADRW